MSENNRKQLIYTKLVEDLKSELIAQMHWYGQRLLDTELNSNSFVRANIIPPLEHGMFLFKMCSVTMNVLVHFHGFILAWLGLLQNLQNIPTQNECSLDYTVHTEIFWQV